MNTNKFQFFVFQLFLIMLLTGGCSDEKPTEQEQEFQFHVVDVLPAENGRQIELEPLIKVTFNQQLDSLSISNNVVTLNDSLNGSVTISNNILSFSPNLQLDSNTVYEVELSNDITDIDGNTLENNFKWSFKTVDGAGYNWIESNDTSSHYMTDVIWAQNKFIMVGGLGGRSNIGTISLSSDGIDWISISVNNLNGLNGIVYFKNKFLAVGEQGTVMSSNTGELWQKEVTNNNSWLFDIASSPSKCVAVATGLVLVSGNGSDWEQINVPYDGRIMSVCWAGDKFIATTEGDSLSYLLISENGEDWEKITLNFESQGRKDFYAIGASDDIIIAVGPDENLITSTDGINWIEGDLGLPWNEWVFLKSVLWDGERFIVAGGSHLAWGGFTAISSDGLTWEQHHYVMDNGGEFTSIAWSGVRYVVSSTNMRGRIFYSPN